MEYVPVVVLVAAAAEWSVVKKRYGAPSETGSPYAHLLCDLPARTGPIPVAFLHSGCGKVPAAAATQYAIDTWHPSLLVNIGTCGAIAPALAEGDTVLAARTVIYDLSERSGGQATMVERFTTDIDLSWLPDPLPACAVQGTVVTADQDLPPDRVNELRLEYDAIAGDWESGAVAFVAQKTNGVRCLILRTVTDCVTQAGSEIYGDEAAFRQRVECLLPALLDSLPRWLTCGHILAAANGEAEV